MLLAAEFPQSGKLKKLREMLQENGPAGFIPWHPPQAMPDEHDVVFHDESGFNLWMARTRGRARSGQRDLIVGNQRGPNFTCLMALQHRGTIHSDFQMDGTTGAVFRVFISEASSRIDGPGSCVLDNAPCHRSVWNADSRDIHTVLFLQAYSPFLKIEENAWSSWKAALKAQFASRLHMRLTPYQ